MLGNNILKNDVVGCFQKSKIKGSNTQRLGPLSIVEMKANCKLHVSQ